MDVSLNPGQEKQLRDLARELGRPAEELVCEILSEALSRRTTPVNGKVIPNAAVPPERRLSNLRGLGKEIWQGEDAQEYVNRLREKEWR